MSKDNISLALDELDTIDAQIKTWQQQLGVHWSGPRPQKLKLIVDQYHSIAHDALRGVEAHRTDLVVSFRALSMILSGVCNAATHREKDARLRAAIELIEGAIERLERQKFEFNLHWTGFPQLFKSDYPSRAYVERIHALEREIAELKQQQGQSGVAEGETQ